MAIPCEKCSYVAHVSANGRLLGWYEGPDRETVERVLGAVVHLITTHVNADGKHGYYNVTPKR